MVFRDLVARLESLPRWADYRSGSEYSHKLVSTLFTRDKVMKVEVAKLKSELSADQVKVFRQVMSIELDRLFENGTILRKSRPKEPPTKSLEETLAELEALKIDVK
jgi:hypothetical protein